MNFSVHFVLASCQHVHFPHCLHLSQEVLFKVAQPLDETELLLSLQLALKCSDLGHTAACLPVHLKWVASLEEEVRYCINQICEALL